MYIQSQTAYFPKSFYYIPLLCPIMRFYSTTSTHFPAVFNTTMLCFSSVLGLYDPQQLLQYRPQIHGVALSTYPP